MVNSNDFKWITVEQITAIQQQTNLIKPAEGNQEQPQDNKLTLFIQTLDTNRMENSKSPPLK
jgi:hypothetical protein